MDLQPLGEHEVFTAKDGKPRLKIKGRRGFPITMLQGETPEAAWKRFQEKREANTAGKSAGPRPTVKSVAGGGGGPADQILEKLKGIPQADPDRPADPPPRSRKDPTPPPAPPPKVPDDKLLEFIEELCITPGMLWFGMPVPDPDPDHRIDLGDGRMMPGLKPRCEFCRDHFKNQGPVAAKEILELAKKTPALRRSLEKLYTLLGAFGTGTAIGMLFLKPALHHAAPEPVLNTLGPLPLIQVPPREKQMPKPPKRVRHRHAPGAPGPQSPAGASGAAASL